MEMLKWAEFDRFGLICSLEVLLQHGNDTECTLHVSEIVGLPFLPQPHPSSDQ